MKKILLVLLILSVPLGTYAKSFIDMQIEETKKNNKFNTAQRYQGASYEQINAAEIVKQQAKLVKDPGLYSFARYTEIPDADFQKKLKADELIYDKKIAKIFNAKNKNDEEGVNYYRVYRICERIIRANNLDYVNWRVAIRKTPDLNASSSDTNFVMINTGLYDSLGDNDDALAFVIGHEIAHQILGHASRTADLAAQEAIFKRNLKNALKSADGEVAALVLEKRLRDVYRELRQMEYMADSEGLNLIIKAGFSPENAIDTLTLLESGAGRYVFADDTHPHTALRIENYKNEYITSDPNWVYVGRENIYNSEVLPCKKSSDRVSFVISKTRNKTKVYRPETLEESLTRKAYSSYLKGHLGLAKQYFVKLIKIKKTDYTPYLYLSYANEVNYKVLKEKKYLKYASRAIKKASKLAPASPYVEQQLKDIEKLKQEAKNDPLAM